MSGYIGATVVGLETTAADVTGDITATDDSPELTLKNSTKEDSDGGRESKITFKGEQSGGEESTLAQIESAHDGTADDQKGDLIFKTNDGSDGASPTERMRIDSDGSLRIANTTGTLFNSSSATGIVASTALQVATDSSTVGYFNRQGNDGQILGLYQDGSQVGAIGVASTDHFYFAATDGAGLKVDSDESSGVTPCNSSGADLDGSINIGHATARWNNLYLSGGAFLGGTTSSNYLEDYEEGTFSVGFTGATITPANSIAVYTKIGRIVYWSYYSGASTIASSSGSAFLTGLPFTIINDARFGYSTLVIAHNTFFGGSATVGMQGYHNINDTKVVFNNQGSTSSGPFVDGSNKFLMVTGTYITN